MWDPARAMSERHYTPAAESCMSTTAGTRITKVVLAHSRSLVWHFWLSWLRLLACLFQTGQLAAPLVIAWVYGPSETRSAAYPDACLMVTWFILAIHDTYMLTLDFRRTNTYTGSLLAQLVVGVITLAATASTIVVVYLELLAAKANFGGTTQLGFGYIAWSYTGCTVATICSFGLIAIYLVSAWSTQEHASAWTILKVNTKDLLVGISSMTLPAIMTMSGSPRDTGFSRKHIMRSCYAEVQVFFTNLFLRRVSPAETRLYALLRNTFAVIAILAILFRAITAMVTVQNEFETRVYSGRCPEFYLDFNANDIQVVMQAPDSSMKDFGLGVNVTILYQVEQKEVTCVPQTLPASTFYNDSSQVTKGSNWFTVFECVYPGANPIWQVKPSQTSYVIKAWSLNGTALRSDSMPRIWLTSRADSFLPPRLSSIPTFRSATPWLTPSWQLIPGSHLQAEAGLVRRRFISSSIWRDTIAKLKTQYSEVAIFPLTTTSNTISSISNGAEIATGTITPILRPVYSPFRDRAIFDQPNWSINDLDMCDYIQDYRSGTFFDVIGSVGGLFAVLQAWHMLLFGRPLLWGFTGAKLITPFGMLGACASRSFRRRLRDQYHYSSPHSTEADEVMRVSAFLQDFVIDFGPADVEMGHDRSTKDLHRRHSSFNALPDPEAARLS